MAQLRFKTLAISAYAGIDKETGSHVEIESPLKIDEEQLKNADPENGLMIIFPDGYPMMLSEGNQGVGKTSLMAAIHEVCGGDAPKNVVNTKDYDKKVSAEFIGKDGNLYHLRLTKTGISLDRIVTDENGEVLLDQKGKEQKVKVASPKTMLAELVGPAGVSPQWLREKDGKSQIAWLRSIMVADQEVVKFESEVLPKLKQYETQRTDKNREYTGLKKTLENNEYYNDMEKWQGYFKTADPKKAVEKYEKALAAYQEYSKAENLLVNLREQLPTLDDQEKEIDRQIAELMARKERIAEQKGSIKERIANGERFLNANKNVKEEFEVAEAENKEAAKVEVQQQAFDQMMVFKKQMDAASDEAIRLEGLVDEYRKKKKEMVQMFTPAVEGLEVCVPDDTEKREGIYYMAKPLNQLAESEMWEMCAALWKELKIKVILVENISSLGTGAVEQFNQFINNGGYVFATQMNRSLSNMKITWNTKIPD